MHETSMTLDEFESHLDRHGASVDAWPTHAAKQGRALLDSSGRAHDLLAEARTLETLLEGAMPAVALTTGTLRGRILAEVARQNRPMLKRGQRWWWLERGWMNGRRMLRPIAFAAALIPLFLGYAIGIGYQSGVTDELASDVSLFAFTDYETYSDAN